jgi:hypothetical protein
MFNGPPEALFNPSVHATGSGLNEKAALHASTGKSRKSGAGQTWSKRKFIMRTPSSFGFICR